MRWHGGKGSTPRPVRDTASFDSNWERIFGKKTINPAEVESANASGTGSADAGENTTGNADSTQSNPATVSQATSK